MAGEETLSRGEQTRANILQAAYEMFLHNGYHGASMRAIAERAGVALGGIYNHFSSKEEIFTSVVKAYHPANEIIPALYKAGGDSAESILRSATHLMVDRITQRPEFLNLFFIELVEFKGRHIPAILGSFMPRIMEFADRLTPYASEMRPVPIPILVRVFISMTLAYILTELFVGAIFPKEFRQEGQKYFLDIFLYGVLRKEEEHG